MCLILKYWLQVSAVTSHLQAKFYIHLVDLHNEYLRAIGSNVALQYYGNVCNERSRAAVRLLLNTHKRPDIHYVSQLSECKTWPEDGCPQPKHVVNTLILNI
jgi:hypothetical protein